MLTHEFQKVSEYKKEAYSRDDELAHALGYYQLACLHINDRKSLDYQVARLVQSDLFEVSFSLARYIGLSIPDDVKVLPQLRDCLSDRVPLMRPLKTFIQRLISLESEDQLIHQNYIDCVYACSDTMDYLYYLLSPSPSEQGSYSKVIGINVSLITAALKEPTLSELELQSIRELLTQTASLVLKQLCPILLQNGYVHKIRAATPINVKSNLKAKEVSFRTYCSSMLKSIYILTHENISNEQIIEIVKDMDAQSY